MKVGPYDLIRELGRGGMAQVWLAHRVWEDGERRACVLKFPRRSAVTDEGMLRQFLEEWRLAILLRHNNIVTVFDAGVHEGLPYLVMDYVAGKDLAELIRTLSRLSKQFDLETAVHVVRELGQGLLYAHELEYNGVPQRIVHRDVGTKNAMIDGSGGVLLMDFGVATSLRTKTSRVHVKGTLTCMAPEQYLGQAGATSDVYGLGTILWELLAGRPFRGDLEGEALLAAIVSGVVQPVGHELPPVVKRVLDGMLEPVAAQRITLREVLRALQDFPSRQLHLQEMMSTYFGRAGKRTGLSSIHYAASKELTDTLAVVKVAGVSVADVRRRKLPGQPKEVPAGFVPGPPEDTARVDPRAMTAGVDDDVDEDRGGGAAARDEVGWGELERDESERDESERDESERDDDAVSAVTNRWRTPAGTARAPRAPLPAAVAAVAVQPPAPATVRVERGARGDTLRSPRSDDPSPALQTTLRLQTPLMLDGEQAGQTEFLLPPAMDPTVAPPSPTRVDERLRTDPRPANGSPVRVSMMVVPLMLMVLGLIAWTAWPRGGEAELAVASVAEARQSPAVVAAVANPTQDTGLDGAEDPGEAGVPIAAPMPVPEPEPAAASPVVDVAEPAVDPPPALPPEPEPDPVPQPQPASADEGSAPKPSARPPKPKPKPAVPKLEVEVRRGLIVDHGEIRVGRGKVIEVPARGSVTLHVAPGTHTLWYRTKRDAEWRHKRQSFSANRVYAIFLEQSGPRVHDVPARGKGP